MSRPTPPGQPEVLGEVIITVHDTNPPQCSISVTAAERRYSLDEIEQLALQKLQERARTS